MKSPTDVIMVLYGIMGICRDYKLNNKEMKKANVFLVFGSILLSVCLSYSAMNLKQASSELVMSDVESISQNEINPCGNVTYIPEEALRTAQCWNGATHKKCKKEENVCCNPSDQTDCAPLFKK